MKPHPWLAPVVSLAVLCAIALSVGLLVHYSTPSSSTPDSLTSYSNYDLTFSLIQIGNFSAINITFYASQLQYELTLATSSLSNQIFVTSLSSGSIISHIVIAASSIATSTPTSLLLQRFSTAVAQINATRSFFQQYPINGNQTIVAQFTTPFAACHNSSYFPLCAIGFTSASSSSSSSTGVQSSSSSSSSSSSPSIPVPVPIDCLAGYGGPGCNNSSFIAIFQCSKLWLPLRSTGTYNFSIDWGDGISSTITSYNQADTVHVYSTVGAYRVVINGTLIGWSHFGITTLQNNYCGGLSEIIQWGSLTFTADNPRIFGGCLFLTTISAQDAPVIKDLTDMSYMFYTTSVTTIPNINHWNVSKVTTMAYMFNVSPFNSNISKWDVSHVTDMTNMFSGTSSSPNSFNMPLGKWNPVAVTSMNSMFAYNSQFNQPISHWNTSSLVDMSQMFQSTTLFNQDLFWDTSKVTSLSSTFNSATAFNGNISKWDVSSVISMSGTFQFASSFNSDISNWNTLQVTLLDVAFSNATSFNQNIGNWQFNSLTGATNTFHNAALFNQNLGNWDIRNVGRLTLIGFLVNSGLSRSNYDATLIGWWTNWGTSRTSITLDASPARYSCAPSVAASARNNLTTFDSWIINDGGCV